MALNEFVQTALDEEGYEEGSDGYTKYGSLSIFAAITRATNIYDMSGSCIVRAAHNLTATQEI